MGLYLRCIDAWGPACTRPSMQLEPCLSPLRTSIMCNDAHVYIKQTTSRLYYLANNKNNILFLLPSYLLPDLLRVYCLFELLSPGNWVGPCNVHFRLCPHASSLPYLLMWAAVPLTCLPTLCTPRHRQHGSLLPPHFAGRSLPVTMCCPHGYVG